jgi:hypothetical protein
MACTKNPIVSYIDYIMGLYNTTGNTDSIETLVADNNFVNLGSSDEYCCPDCGDFTYLGPAYNTVESQDILIDSIFDTIGTRSECCDNYDIQNAAYAFTIVDNATNINPLVCCNTFNSCSTEFSNLIQDTTVSPLSNGLYQAGIREYGTVNNESSLCLVLAKLKLLGNLSPGFPITSFLKAMIDNEGFVAYCDGTNVYAGTGTGIISWW